MNLEDKGLLPSDQHWILFWPSLWFSTWETELRDQRVFAKKFQEITGFKYKHSFRWHVSDKHRYDYEDFYSKANEDARWSDSYPLGTPFPYFKEQFLNLWTETYGNSEESLKMFYEKYPDPTLQTLKTKIELLETEYKKGGACCPKGIFYPHFINLFHNCWLLGDINTHIVLFSFIGECFPAPDKSPLDEFVKPGKVPGWNPDEYKKKLDDFLETKTLDPDPDDDVDVTIGESPEETTTTPPPGKSPEETTTTPPPGKSPEETTTSDIPILPDILVSELKKKAPEDRTPEENHLILSTNLEGFCKKFNLVLWLRNDCPVDQHW
jgi:hypothetical protein